MKRLLPIADAFGLSSSIFASLPAATYPTLTNAPQYTDSTLEAGHQTSHYYNAIDHLTSAVASAGLRTVVNQRTTDLGIDGPYVSLEMHAGMI